MSRRVFFQEGTLVLADVPENEAIPTPFQWIKGRWRCEAYHYAALEGWFKSAEIQNGVPRWERLSLSWQDERQAHDYQTEALAAWEKHHRRGSIVLPTGAGKTFVAIRAIYEVGRSAVVLAPTIDLLHQWYARVGNALGCPIGVYYGAEKDIQPITITTYHSAGDLMALAGNTFKLLIFDEVHHLPAPTWGETALMSPAPFRLGLTATYPDAVFDGRWRLEDLLGEVVYQLRIEDLVGDQLAEYRTERIRIDLSPAERELYEEAFAVYSAYFRENQLQRRYGKSWLLELMRRSSFELKARRAWLARERLSHILAGASGKMRVLDQILREYFHEKMLIFTEHNAIAYQIAREHLIPAITHQTKAAERKHILEGFQSGLYRAIVTSKVLNEGIDVPEAKIALVLGGTAQKREYIQRLGRVLRKVGNREAVLFEVIARKTIEENKAQRRRPQQS